MGWLPIRWMALIGISAALLTLAAPAHAEKRVALVIGNNDYRNVPKLQKAVNDARTMGDTLKQLGFSVMVAENQTRQAFSQTLLQFDATIEPGDTAFFFFAGHGFEIAGPEFSAADRRARGERGPGGTGARRLDPGRPHRRAVAAAGDAHGDPGVRCLPQQSVRAQRHPRGGRRRWPRADDAVAGRACSRCFRRVRGRPRWTGSPTTTTIPIRCSPAPSPRNC